jgi:uncharacterized protein YdeI (YjbR/CyaY-like superfamily)
MAALDDAEQIEPVDRAGWRAWLQRHHATVTGVWVIRRPRAANDSALTYDDIVEEALCFGWIDSTARKFDDGRQGQYVARRRPGGTWAATNKARVERLLAEGRMSGAGRAAVERAKSDGSWNALDSVEALELPDDLDQAFAEHPRLARAYDDATNSAKKQVLWYLASAKRDETRARRLRELIRRGEDDEPLVR